MSTAPRTPVAAVIVSYNTRDLLPMALEPLLALPDVDVVVVDNASEDGSADLVQEHFPRVHLLRQTINLGFAAGVNLGVAATHAPYVLLLNPDAALGPGALEALTRLLEDRPRVAAVGGALRYADGRPQASAFALPGLAQVVLDLFPVPRLADTRLNGRYPESRQPHPVGHPLGACMLVRRAAWEEVGPLDDGYFMYVEEVDWCRRAWERGWEIWTEPRAEAVHLAGQATRQAPERMFVQLWASRLRYYERHLGPRYNAVVRAIVRQGLAAEARRARRWLCGRPLERRLAALEQVARLAR